MNDVAADGAGRGRKQRAKKQRKTNSKRQSSKDNVKKVVTQKGKEKGSGRHRLP